MMIDFTVRVAKANDATSRRLAEEQRRGFIGQVVRIPRQWRDQRGLSVSLANQGYEYDDFLEAWAPPASNEFVIERRPYETH